MTALEYDKLIESFVNEPITTTKEDMYKILEDNDVYFECVCDMGNALEFEIDYLDRDKLIKALKSLTGEFEEIQNSIEYWNDKTDIYCTFDFEELEPSQEMERDREYWEYIRTESLYW